MTQAPAPGVHRGIPEYDYRAWDAVNQSTLWTFRRSPAHARYAFLHPDSTPTTDLGSAIHAVLLEPDKLERDFAVRPKGIDRRTSKGRVAWAEFAAESVGKTILPQREAWDTLEGIRDSLARHELARTLLASRGINEASAVWVDPETEVLCKGRVDRIVDHAGWTWLVDAKSTTDASPWAFRRSVDNYGYHVQAAFYLDGLDVLDERDRRFAFVALEKSPPYEMKVYELDLIYLEAGRADYRRWLKRWKRCMASGEWPGYPDEIETLEAPPWLEKRVYAQEEP